MYKKIKVFIFNFMKKVWKKLSLDKYFSLKENIEYSTINLISKNRVVKLLKNTISYFWRSSNTIDEFINKLYELGFDDNDVKVFGRSYYIQSCYFDPSSNELNFISKNKATGLLMNIINDLFYTLGNSRCIEKLYELNFDNVDIELLGFSNQLKIYKKSKGKVNEL